MPSKEFHTPIRTLIDLLLLSSSPPDVTQLRESNAALYRTLDYKDVLEAPGRKHTYQRIGTACRPISCAIICRIIKRVIKKKHLNASKCQRGEGDGVGDMTGCSGKDSSDCKNDPHSTRTAEASAQNKIKGKRELFKRFIYIQQDLQSVLSRRKANGWLNSCKDEIVYLKGVSQTRDVVERDPNSYSTLKSKVIPQSSHSYSRSISVSISALSIPCG